jgi:2-polyprenyl-3-methyl-5-hydroxy-6-metoxy-1,4-benzoquinol methylase
LLNGRIEVTDFQAPTLMTATQEDPRATEASKKSQDIIRTAPAPNCCLCKQRGEVIHEALTDRLFDAPGDWNLKQCSNADCRLVWPDPMPLPEDIWKAYAKYYTHSATSEFSPPGRIRRIYHLMKRGYLAGRFNYPVPSPALATKWLGKALYFIPGRRTETEAQVRLLPSVPGGKLLDVGCGSGEWLLWMRELGWAVEGLDFDQNALRAAALQGLTVRSGTVEDQCYPNECLDAVTLNHVIEHVPDPVSTLVECARILKPGGKLFLATPNASSLGHKLFGADWRGLEPPRHLHIFAVESMAALLRKAGFTEFRISTSHSPYIWEQSLRLRSQRLGRRSKNKGSASTMKERLFVALLSIVELASIAMKPGSGGCLKVIAVKG